MRAVDTNVLVYSEVISLPQHRIARSVLTQLAEGLVPWAIPWPCIYEFLRVVTHPRVFAPPVPMDVALHDLDQILMSPTLVLLSETERHAGVMKNIVEDSGVTGNLLHDAHIAALCVEPLLSKTDEDPEREVRKVKELRGMREWSENDTCAAVRNSKE